ncbi:MAG: twin-arginine translocase TatA/TatE family subunit [Gammaproteobacteria bacterium]
MGVSVTQLLIILVIVIVLFGTKRLRNLGSDLGSAIKSFRSAMKEGEEGKKLTEEESENIESQIDSKEDKKV